MHLIKAACPFEQISFDFKGPLPLTNQNRFLITIIDKYSQFLFAFPCRDTCAKSIISSLDQVFTIFGMPTYTHSDRRSVDKSIASSRTTTYNPAENRQVEHLNQTLCQTIKLRLKTHKLPLQHWQELLKAMLYILLAAYFCMQLNKLLRNEFLSFSVGPYLAPRYRLGLQLLDRF